MSRLRTQYTADDGHEIVPHSVEAYRLASQHLRRAIDVLNNEVERGLVPDECRFTRERATSALSQLAAYCGSLAEGMERYAGKYPDADDIARREAKFYLDSAIRALRRRK